MSFNSFKCSEILFFFNHYLIQMHTLPIQKENTYFASSLQVFHYLQNVNFTTKQGEQVFFDENGDSPAIYELINLQSVTSGAMQIAQIGVYNSAFPSDNQFTMNGIPIVWGGGIYRVHAAFFSHLWLAGQNALLHNI